jgi:hypothetical protein
MILGFLECSRKVLKWENTLRAKRIAKRLVKSVHLRKVKQHKWIVKWKEELETRNCGPYYDSKYVRNIKEDFNEKYSNYLQLV